MASRGMRPARNTDSEAHRPLAVPHLAAGRLARSLLRAGHGEEVMNRESNVKKLDSWNGKRAAKLSSSLAVLDSELNHTVGLQPTVSTSPVGSLAVGIPTVFFRDLSGPESGGFK